VAMVGGTVLTVLVVTVSRRRGIRAWVLAGVVVAGLGLVYWVGMSESVYAELATLFDEQAVTHARGEVWEAATKTAGEFWPLGSGLGTFRFVHGPFRDGVWGSHWFYHVENEYLQALVEGGIVGLGLILAALGLVAVAAWRLVRCGPGTRTWAFGIAGVFAIGAQGIAAGGDFGLHRSARRGSPQAAILGCTSPRT